MPRPRQTLILFAAVAALALCALAPRAAHAQAKGKIYVSDVEFGNYGSEKEMAAAIKRQSKTTIKEEGGTWPLNFMIFLGGGIGPAAVAGLSGIVSVPMALALLAALPLAGLVLTLTRRPITH